MDAFARSLIIANKILSDSELPKLLMERYSSFQTENGKKYEKGELTLEELYDLSLKFGEPEKISGKQELFESIINNYI